MTPTSFWDFPGVDKIPRNSYWRVVPALLSVSQTGILRHKPRTHLWTAAMRHPSAMREWGNCCLLGGLQAWLYPDGMLAVMPLNSPDAQYQAAQRLADMPHEVKQVLLPNPLAWEATPDPAALKLLRRSPNVTILNDWGLYRDRQIQAFGASRNPTAKISRGV